MGVLPLGAGGFGGALEETHELGEFLYPPLIPDQLGEEVQAAGVCEGSAGELPRVPRGMKTGRGAALGIRENDRQAVGEGRGEGHG